MPKRLAGSQMTQENWDQEDDNDDTAGQVGIPQASSEAMKGRVIKVARRKGIAGASGTDSKSAFTGFGGFGALKPQMSFSAAPGKMPSEPAKPTTNGTKDAGATKNARSDEYYAKLRALNESVSSWIKSHVDKNPYCILTPVFRDYEKHLETVEKLNADSEHEAASGGASSAPGSTGGSLSVTEKSESKRVSFHLQQDKTVEEPAKPAFSFGLTNAQKSTSAGLFSFGEKSSEKDTETAASKPAEVPKFSFGAKSETNESKTDPPKFSLGVKSVTDSKTDPPISFGVKSETESETKTDPPKFSFATSVSDSAPKISFGTGVGSFGGAGGGFSFSSTPADGAAKPFSFASGGATSGGQAASAGGDDEEYVPPKPEVNEVKEEGATYTKRCKLFWMMEGSWKERGLGNLHLKPVDSGKTQLIIRADTNLGNILLNIMLNDSIPVSRSGKNMVNLICIPNPPFDPKADPKPEKLLLKVKTAEDADELYEKLDEAKK